MSALFSSLNLENDKGTFAAGFRFIDWLKTTHQSAWQLLPLHQTQLEPGASTTHVPSPYKGYGIGLDPKYLPEAFTMIYPSEEEKKSFISLHKEWIHDYALFCALRDYFHTDDWRLWDKDIRQRRADVIVYWKKKLKEHINTHIIIQWQVHKAYHELKNKAKTCNIVLVGDLPFYLSVQGPLVWKNQALFELEKDGSMKFVSGVPYRKNSLFGRQIWGHPLYRWDSRELLQKIIKLWIMRLQYSSGLFDVIRLDSAIAFFRYDVIDPVHPDNDTYKSGPGLTVLSALSTFSRTKGFQLIAENLGRNVDELRAAMHTLNIPGMKVFRFAYDQKKDIINNRYAFIMHYPKETVAYTTTHDTETLLSYVNSLTRDQKQRLAAASGIIFDQDDKVFAKTIRDAVLTSPANMVIIPIQDWLFTTDRINIPGTETPVDDPNWRFRLKIPIEDLPVNLL